MRTSRVALFLVPVVAVLTACSSSDKPSAATATTPKPPVTAASAASLDPCALLPAADVSKAISLPNLTSAPGPVQDNAANGGKARTCEYRIDGKSVGALAVTRYEGRDAKPAEMVAAIKKAKAGAQDVAGFPDGAVYYLDEQKTATLAAAEKVAGVPVLVNFTSAAKVTAAMMTPLVKTALDNG